MVAKSWSRDRDKVLVERKKSQDPQDNALQTRSGRTAPRITTWNRDVNASRNILMLLMRRSKDLSDRFSSKQLPERSARFKSHLVQITEALLCTGYPKVLL
jgi:hypothetical protein